MPIPQPGCEIIFVNINMRMRALLWKWLLIGVILDILYVCMYVYMYAHIQSISGTACTGDWGRANLCKGLKVPLSASYP